MFKGLSNLATLLKQAQQIGGQLDRLAEDLKNRRATASAGGGMVEIEINGVLDVLRCRIDPQLVVQGDRELIEDLVVAAMNQAVAKGKQLHAAALKEKTGALELPGLDEALARLTGSEPPPPVDHEKEQ
jgi:DNA-binding YbaB/EbfC family protein